MGSQLCADLYADLLVTLTPAAVHSEQQQWLEGIANVARHGLVGDGLAVHVYDILEEEGDSDRHHSEQEMEIEMEEAEQWCFLDVEECQEELVQTSGDSNR